MNEKKKIYSGGIELETTTSIRLVPLFLYIYLFMLIADKKSST